MSLQLWQPDVATIANSNLKHYFDWLRQYSDGFLDFESDAEGYQRAWQWSIDRHDDFWASLIAYFEIMHDGNWDYVSQGTMPNTKWFEGIKLNYAAHVFRQTTDKYPAIIFQSETRPAIEISWQSLAEQVSAMADFLRKQGVVKGDCVVGYLPNIPEATVAMLATVSIGAIWSSASPDFGADSVLERFGQIKPKVLIAINAYQYGGKVFDKMDTVAAIQSEISSLTCTVLIDYAAAKKHDLSAVVDWSQAIVYNGQVLDFERVEFAHPLWVLYSSGTTGKPKAITHSQGGMLMEHLKYVHFHADVKPGERFFWFTTTGWMMWNFLNATLLRGATMVLYDGSPGFPDMNVLWQLVEAQRVQHFGTSAAFILASMKAEVSPKARNWSHLRAISSTGSPLPPEGFAWIYEQVKSDIWLTSMSGGTDVCTAFVGGNPLLAVYQGEIQCRTLGAAIEAYDEQKQVLPIDTVGELVLTKPMPCMPIFFWNDPDGQKYRDAYFEDYGDIWRHGDWIKITPNQGLVILGRSDATLNRQGIRIGTSEIYRAVEQLPEIKDSLIINIEYADGESFMPLFVSLKPNIVFDESLKKRIAQELRGQYSPRHVPDEIHVVPDIPYTISGKKFELPIKRILMGKPFEQAVNIGSVRNPEAFSFFVDFALHKKSNE